MKLSEMPTGQTGYITKIHGHGAFKKRVMEMGFVRGKKVTVLLNAPLKDPIKYKILDYEISLRRNEAELIDVDPITDESVNNIISSNSKTSENGHNEHHEQVINVALIGNPNCGKTSIFNFISGEHEHVGNYSGVTVDAKTGHVIFEGVRINIVDLPGTYSLSAYSPEEQYVRRYLRDEMPDVIVNVVVASNLERNLYLTTELIDMDCSMVIALNMYDELENSGAKLDADSLGRMIGVPIVPTISKTGEGIHNLFRTIIDVFENRNDAVRHVHVNLNPDVEKAITAIKDQIKHSPHSNLKFSPRYIAIRLLDNDPGAIELISDMPEYESIIKTRDYWTEKISRDLNDDISSIIASEKYGFISGALKETYTPAPSNTTDTTRVIDAVVTNKIIGFPLFFAVMLFMFWCTFEVGSYPMEWIEQGVEFIGNIVNRLMPSGPLKDMLIDGVIGGVGGVIVFLPNILILYFFISFMEDSGYMARAAFIMDKLMHKIGLHGKSFIPLVMGFGCNVPAIMATRSIESSSSRIITILINPFMSCSARLPIYILLIGTFFPNYPALMFGCLYTFGIIIAIITARLLRKFLFTKDETPFVMELPPYRIPTFKASVRHMWSKGEQYLRKMGGIILIGSIVIWALSYFPRDYSKPQEIMTESEIVAQQNNSYLAQLGQFVAPVLEPCGMNWKMSVALISGASAKEIVVSTLGVLYPTTNENPDQSLSSRLTQINPETGVPDFTPIQALAFMVFVLLYFPCIASIAAIARETGSWRYATFSIIYNTVVAWIFSFAVFQIGKLFI